MVKTVTGLDRFLTIGFNQVDQRLVSSSQDNLFFRLGEDFKTYNLCIKGRLTSQVLHIKLLPLLNKSCYCNRMSYDFLLCCNILYDNIILS